MNFAVLKPCKKRVCLRELFRPSDVNLPSDFLSVLPLRRFKPFRCQSFFLRLPFPIVHHLAFDCTKFRRSEQHKFPRESIEGRSGKPRPTNYSNSHRQGSWYSATSLCLPPLFVTSSPSAYTPLKSNGCRSSYHHTMSFGGGLVLGRKRSLPRHGLCHTQKDATG